MLGLFLAAGGLGAFLGSTAAPALARRLGFGRALWLVGIGVAPFALLNVQIRQRAGRRPNPVTAVIDTQSVKATETAAKTRTGYDGGRRSTGSSGSSRWTRWAYLLLTVVTSAAMTDRDIARDVLFRLRLAHPQLTLVWADSAFSGELVTWAREFLGLTRKIVPRPRDQVGFVVLPRRWIVERAISWLGPGATQPPRLRTPPAARRGAPDLVGNHPDEKAPSPQSQAPTPAGSGPARAAGRMTPRSGRRRG